MVVGSEVGQRAGDGIVKSIKKRDTSQPYQPSKYGKSIPKGNRVYDDLGLVDFKNIFSLLIRESSI